MATWYAASPYKASNMYIGGASRGCAQPNLTADWVAQTIAQGWTLIPTYVGLQASCSDYPNKIDPAQAAAQGAAAADDAIVQLNALGLGGGNPVYFDMEAYNYNNATCLTATRTFLGAWTDRLHDRGYVSGIYSSSNALAATVFDGTTQANRVPTTAMTAPDALWFARWPADSKTQPGDPTLSDPAIPDQYFADHQRIHQYRGGHQETWGGVTVNIDNNSVDAPVAPFQLAPEGAFVQASGGGATYRIAGGAPIPVTDWAAVGGAAAGADPVATQFDSLPDRPREGTFLQSGATGRIWRVVKGVATYVPSWTPYGGPQPSHRRSTRRRSTTPAPAASGTTSPAAVPIVAHDRPDDVRQLRARASGSAGPAATRPAPSATTTCGGARPGGTARSARGRCPPKWQRRTHHRRVAEPAARLHLLRLGPRPEPGRPGVRLDRRPVPGPVAGRPQPEPLVRLVGEEQHRLPQRHLPHDQRKARR